MKQNSRMGAPVAPFPFVDIVHNAQEKRITLAILWIVSFVDIVYNKDTVKNTKQQEDNTMYAVKFFSRWNGFFNEYETKEFVTLEEAKAFAADCYNPTIMKKVPSTYPNSIWMYEPIK